MLKRVGGPLHVCGRFLLWAALLFALALGGLALRFAHGPLELPMLAERIAVEASRSLAPWQVSVERTSLGWAGDGEPLDRPLELSLGTVRILDEAGTLRAELPRVQVSLGIRALLQGKLAPRAIAVHDARLALRRDPGGGWMVAAQPDAPAPDPAAVVAPPDAGAMAQAQPPLEEALARELRALVANLDPARLPRELADLGRLRIVGASLEVQDDAWGRHWSVSAFDLDLRRERGGVVARLAATPELDGTAVPVRLELQGGPEAGRVTLELRPFELGFLARNVASLAPLAGLEVPVAASLRLGWGSGGTPQLRFSFDLGAGRVRPPVLLGRPGTRPDSIPLGGALLEGRVAFDRDLAPERLVVETLDLELGPVSSATPSRIQGSLSAERGADGAWTGEASAALDHVALADLPHLWPEALGGNERAWMTENLTAGELDRLTAQLGFRFDPAGFDFDLERLSGGGRGSGIEVHWLRPVPPVTGVSGHFVLGLDEIRIELEGGRTGDVRLPSGVVRLSSLRAPPERAQIALDLTSPLPALLALLSHPRLKLFDSRPLEIAGATGAATGKVEVGLPLLREVRVEDLAIRAEGQVQGGAVPKAFLGQDLADVSIAFTLDQNGMRVNGTASVNGDALRLTHTEDFRGGPGTQVIVQETVQARLDTEKLRRFGVDLLPNVTGPLEIEARRTTRRSGAGEVAVQANLAGARLAVEELDWVKPPGRPATATGTLRLERDRPLSIEQARLEAGPDRAHGRAVFDRSGARIELWDLTEIRLGESNLRGRIRPSHANAPLSFDVTGSVFDATALLAPADPAQPPAHEADSATAVRVEARFDRLITGPQRSIADARITLDQRAGRIQRLDATGRTVGGRFEARVTPGAGGRSLAIDSEDAGGLLASLGVLRSMEGGRLAVRGTWADRAIGRPLQGSVEITSFRMRDAPGVARVLTGMTLYGLVDLARGPGLAFDRLTAPFTLRGPRLELTDARAFSQALGVTAAGTIDTARFEGDLTGTIVPAYAINAALGNLPIIGRLFAPEEGGGLFAATWRVRGSLSDPEVSVNPLSALTPGILRNLFGLSSEGRAPPPPQANDRPN